MTKHEQGLPRARLVMVSGIPGVYLPDTSELVSGEISVPYYGAHHLRGPKPGEEEDGCRAVLVSLASTLGDFRLVKRVSKRGQKWMFGADSAGRRILGAGDRGFKSRRPYSAFY